MDLMDFLGRSSSAFVSKRMSVYSLLLRGLLSKVGLPVYAHCCVRVRFRRIAPQIDISSQILIHRLTPHSFKKRQKLMNILEENPNE